MPTNPLGAGVTRSINDRDKQFAAVVFQAIKPPLDSELNLISLIDLESKAEEVRSRVASGWLMDELNPRSDYFTDPNFSNQFYFGKQFSGEVRNLSWAVINGWMIPVSGTRTGQPPLAANDVEYWNRVQLNPPSTSTGGNRAEFVFLEAWLQRIDVDPAPPAVATGKPQRGYIYKFGNVEGGFTFLPDELVDPDINYETTKRVQIQYRIRVVTDINLVQYPEGFDPTSVYAQGALSSPSVVPFQNMRGELGDPGLWRAGTGDPSTFGTIDGYVYAVPICAVFRRNSAGFSDTGNLAGAFNRNSKALLRTDSTSYTNQVILPADLSDIATSFTLTSLSGTILSTLSLFGEAYFKIDDEIVRVTNIIQVSPVNFTIVIDRGQLGTIIKQHLAGKILVPYTVRPDGLYADQVTGTDILDLRHSVADKFDYDSILKTNVMELLKGNLRSTWKRYGSTNSSGPVILYGDRITDSSIFVGGLTRLDAPDGNRKTWSDSVVTQRFNIPVKVPNNASVIGNSLSSPVQVVPYTASITWNAAPPLHGVGNRLVGGTYQSWWNGDQIKVEIAPFRTGVAGSDADQIRFVLPSEDLDSVIVRFEGMTTDPNGGLPSTTSPSATNPTFGVPTTGKLILKNGNGLVVTTDVDGSLLITLQSGAVDTQLAEFVDALQGNTAVPFVERVVMHVEFTIMYGSGRGLSHKPDWIHTAQWRGSPTNTSKTLLRGGLTDKNRMIPTYVGDSPLVQTGNDRQYSRTSEVMVDPGSKTVHVAPYRFMEIPSLLARNGNSLNWYGLAPYTYQGAMPTKSQDGSVVVHSTVDPLDLFYNGNTETRYVEISPDFLPKPGLHHVPIQPVTNTVFSSGINFMFMSMEGVVGSNSSYNRNIISYPSTPGYYIVTPLIGETYGTGSGVSIFGQKVSISKLRSVNGGPFRGIRFPPFLGPARITGVYARNTSVLPAPVVPAASPFDNNRVYTGGAGTDTNLLKDDFDGPTYLLDVDANGDLTFVLNADVLDLTKISAGATFDNTEFLVECTLFGFDRGFLQTNGRVLIAKSTGGGSTPINIDTDFTVSNTVGLIVPAPMSYNSVNNELTLYYSRAPYQGDPFGTQNAFSDDLYRLGPLTVSEAQTFNANPLGPVNTLAMPAKSGYEVLSAMSFITSQGTGRLSGSAPIPLLNVVEAPNNPPDYAGTRTDLSRKYSLNRVGYEDWATSKWPVLTSSLASRPSTKLGLLSEPFDNDLHPELSGCTVQLPLGAYFRDKDFSGKTLYQSRSSSNFGQIPIGTTSFVPFEASMAKGAPGASSWEGTEFVCGNASNVSGVGSESIIRVDGTYNVASNTVFKTTRGGAAYSATGPWPGGVITSKFQKARPNTDVGSVLMCTAYLVRSAPESNGGNEVHMGHELQMIVVTQAVPSYFRDSEIVHSASGANEGYTAVDRFRLMGKPLEKRRGSVNMSVLPSDKPLYVNKIYDNPLFYGSSDYPSVANKQETLPVTADGQTAFLLSARPLDPTTVQMFVNGVKLQYGVDYSVGGVENKNVTYYPNPPVRPSLLTTDSVEMFYTLF